MRRVVVILGASGRLGCAAQALFTAAGFDVIAVVRTPRAVQRLDGVSWIIADLTIDEDRTRVAATVNAWTAGYSHVCVIDAVLDRSGVDAMRRSVQGVTDAVLGLRDQLGVGGRAWALVAASTTAVLAPGLYQTPYGLAKRRQVITYARSGVAGAALLLPQLTPQNSADVEGQPIWSFEHAARRLVLAVVAAPSQPDFSVRVPVLGTVATGPRSTPHPAASTVVLAHLRSLVLDRDSMQAHRLAARSRLRLTPGRLRLHLDHHLAPVELVCRFAHRYHVTVTDERTFGSSPTGNGTAHA